MGFFGSDDFRQRVLELAADRPAEDLLLARSGIGQDISRTVPGSLVQHTSRCFELAIAVSGGARIATPTDCFQLGQGTLLLIEPGIFHVELLGHPDQGHVTFWCMFDQATAVLSHAVYTPPTSVTGVTMWLPGRTNVENIAAAISSELSARNWGYPRAVRGLLEYLACILVRRLEERRTVLNIPHESPTIANDPNKWTIVHHALEYCSANFRHGVGASDVAKAIGYSPGYLSRLLTTHFGHSLSEHLENLRMSEGRRLLEASTLAIAQIARTIGYSDPAHFTRAFSRVMGLSPRAYRQRAGGR